MSITKHFLILIAILTVFSCSKDPKDILSHINGYWEIEEVTLNDGSKKEYTFNDTIDFIEVSDSLTGTRRKLKPNFQGTFETSNSAETFRIKIENDSLNVYYKTPYANWKETIIDADDHQLIVINNTNKDMYIYKRYEPLDLDTE